MVEINPEDLEISYFNVGMGFFVATNVGCLILHKPSGRRFASKEYSLQSKNKSACFKMLEEFLQKQSAADQLKGEKMRYIVYADTAHQAKEIAISHNINPKTCVYALIGTDLNAYNLPIGFKPDLSILPIHKLASNRYTLKHATQIWHERLFGFLSEEIQQKYIDRVLETLDGFLWCDKHWDAWNLGNMRQDDFSPAGDDESCVLGHAIKNYIMYLEMSSGG